MAPALQREKRSRQGRDSQAGTPRRNPGRYLPRALATLAALLAIGVIAGCSGSSSESVAVRVGGVSIGTGTVSHWIKAVGSSKEVASLLGEAPGSNRERALDFLISSNWLIGEAAEHGLGISDASIERRLQEKISSVPNGKSEFEEEISSTGRTVADVKLEIKAEAAAAALRAMVSKGVAPVTKADIADYYRQSGEQFRVRDVRVTDLIEALPSRAAAIALGKRLGPGRRFAARALHEHVPRQTRYDAAHSKNHELVHTIYAATPGKVAGPVNFSGGWILVVVRKVIPSHIKPLASVSAEIAKRLTSQRHRAALLSFIKAYRSRWGARTDCKPGYIVQKCRQYRGPIVPEGNPLRGY